MLSNRTSLSFSLVTIVLIAAAMPARANLITNGSFEDPTTPPIVPSQITPITGLPGWTLSPNPFYWYMGNQAGYGTAQDGSFFINMTGNSISQSFAVTAGTPYTVSYYEALRADGPGTGDTIATSISLAAGSAMGTTTQTAANTQTNFSQSGWELFSFSFTPTNTTTATLQFTLGSGGIGYPVLDNVSVTAAAVPEPATLTLFSIGITGMVGFGRRRLKAAA